MEDLTAANLLQRSLVALLKYLPVKKFAKPDEVARTGASDDCVCAELTAEV